MEKFIFDLQRFAETFAFTGAAVSTPASEGSTVYYDLSATSTTTFPTKEHSGDYTVGNYYMGVTRTGTTYSFALYKATAKDKLGTASAGDTLALTDMTFTSGMDSAVFAADSYTTLTTPIVTTSAGGSVTAGSSINDGKGTTTYKSVAGVDSTISFTATNATLTKGSVVLTKDTAKTIIAAAKTIALTSTGSTTITVSDEAIVSGMTANTTFTVDGGAAYGVDSFGAKITQGANDWLLTSSSAIGSLTFNAASTEFSGDYITLNKAVNLANLNTKSVTGKSDNIQGSTGGSTYVYQKSNNITEYGYQDSAFGNYLGTVSYNDSEGTYAYDASSSTYAQEIKDATTATATKFASVIGSTGNDTINASAAVYINGADGADDITGGVANGTILGGAGKDTIISAGSEVLVDGGADADDITANNTFSTILGGDGDDKITSYAASNTVTGGAGADIFDISGGTTQEVNISDYNFSEDFVLVNSTTGSIVAAANALVAGGKFGSDGVIDTTTAVAGVLTAGGKATVTGDGVYAVNLRGSDKKTQVVGWVGENGTAIDASSLSGNVVLTGRTNSEGDSLYGGSGKDTIYAGANDTVWGAAGNDDIEIGTGKGVVVGINSASGKDVVNGFHTGFEDGDSIFLVDTEVADASISTATTGTITLKAGSSSTTISGGAANVVNFLINDSKVVTAANGATIAASEANYADFYFGTKNGTVQSALSFSSVSDNVNVDLSDSKKYKNINIVMGGTADNTLMGSSAKETLMAAAGSNTSLYGGAGADSLVGNTGSDNFFFGAGAGKDTVSAFTAGTSDTSDRLTLIDGTIDPTQISRSSASVMKATLNNSDALTVSFANGKVDDKIQFTTTNGDLVAKVGITGATNTFTLDNEVNYYIGSTKLDTLTVSDDDNHEVWLDNANYASIDVINATSSSGNNILAGSSTANTIRAGKGDSSIWGGAGNVADSLVGGTGADTFFWGAGEGNDTVVGNSDDSVNLYSLKLSELTDWSYSSNSLSLTFGEQKLTVNGQVNDYTIEGHTYTLNRSDGTWSEKQ